MPPKPSSRSPLSAADEMFQRALALQRNKELTQAAELYRKILQRTPRHFDALNMLGTIEGQNGRHDEAIMLLKRAVAIRPDSAQAHNNLGIAHSVAWEWPEALASYERSLALKPDNVRALANQGKLLRRLGRLPEALQSLDKALALQPDFGDALMSRADLLAQLASKEPERRDEAVDSLKKALTVGVNEDSLRFALATLGAGDGVPSGLPRALVSQLFNAYADRFDEHLVDTLKYGVPALIGQALSAAGARPGADAIDLGCGTGLCGRWLKPLARRLIGVDLSSKMLDKARERGLYDELVCADIVDDLRTRPSSLDLIVSADVVIYLGDLGPVVTAAAAALRPGGLFVFSVEALNQMPETADAGLLHEDGYLLQPNRRYAHSKAYLQRLALDKGFTIDALEDCVLREEGQTGVEGFLITLRQP